MLRQYKKILGLSLILASPSIIAAEYEINTFMTLGGAYTDNDRGSYLQSINDNVSLEYDSKYGINLRTQVTENLEGAAQLLANGRNGTFEVEAEWFYASYSLGDNVRVRIGKLNLQTFLLSDYIEVGNLYPWVRPPEEVYGLNPMRNFPGVELMHIARFGKRTTLTSQFFIGSAQVDISAASRFKAKDGYGINFQLDTPHFTLRLGGITPVVEVSQSAVIVPDTGTGTPVFQSTGGTLNEGDRMLMLTAGYSFDISNFIGYGEYIDVTADGVTGSIFPDQTGFYATFGYQAGKFLPFFTVASNDGESNYAPLSDPNSPAFGFQPNPLVLQDSLSIGLRYDINDYADIKFEWKSVDPTLDPAMGANAFNAGWSIGNPGTQQTDEKYTVYSLVYDMVF
ncbi:hypothetical protein MNBD_GAMMA09-969 [hydrothermal vent metagenome]|uniref:Porin domain-containing protein n=1 Tax=hydrothermal vent metagenome TaxID=652676 RepID=A0A3B0Y7S6_9ZZZZ